MGTFTRGPMWLQLAQHLLLLWLIHYSDATPFKEPTDLVDPSSLGCYYNYNHYSEGDRILTNEPCLNCTCHNKMLMCYLRVCPFTKPIGQDCTIEKRDDQCCPIITCPEVPVELVDHSSGLHSTSLATPDRYGCHINNQFYAEGAQIPSNPKKPCELCYCIRNMTSCVMQECTLHVEGCSPIYNRDVCCPVRYDCGRDSMDDFLLEESTTTVRPTPGFMLTTTMVPEQNECVHNGVTYNDGEIIESDEPCQHCYCMRGHMICAVQECKAEIENMGKQCKPQPRLEGQCCPTTYDCDMGEETTEESLSLPTTTRTDVSTESDNINEIEDEDLTKPLPTTDHVDEAVGTTLSPLGQRFDLTGESITQSIVDEMIKAQEKLETTTLLFPGFEDIDMNTVIPFMIPGEGACLIDGVTYQNKSEVPVTNEKCDKRCQCLNSIVQCEPLHKCDEPVSKANCRLIEDDDSCCPQYDCTPGVTVSITEVPQGETEKSTESITESPTNATKALAVEDESITELITSIESTKPTEEATFDVTEKPEQETPTSEKPEDETPASEKPGDETPASEKPVDETQASEKPEDETPTSEKPEGETPASEKPVDEAETSEKPEGETPASEKPVDETEASEKPEQESPPSEEHEDESPASEKPGEESSSEKATEESVTSATEQPEKSLDEEQPPQEPSTEKESESIKDVTTEPSSVFEGEITTLAEPGISDESSAVTDAPIEAAKTQQPLSAQPQDESTETPVVEPIAVTKKVYTVAPSTDVTTEQPEFVDLDNRINDDGATPSVPIEKDESTEAEGSGATEPSVASIEEEHTTAPVEETETEGEPSATQKSDIETPVTAAAPSASTEAEISSTEVPSIDSFTNVPEVITEESHVTLSEGEATESSATQEPLQEEGSTEKPTEQEATSAPIEEGTTKASGPSEVDVTEKPVQRVQAATEEAVKPIEEITEEGVISTQKPLSEEELTEEKSEAPTTGESGAATEKPLLEETVPEQVATEPSVEEEAITKEEEKEPVVSVTTLEPAQESSAAEEATKGPVTEEGVAAITESITDKVTPSSEPSKTDKPEIEEPVSEPATSKPEEEEPVTELGIVSEETTKESQPDEGVTDKSLPEETASEPAEVGGTEKPAGEVQTEVSEQVTESGETDAATKPAHPFDSQTESIIEEYITKAAEIATSPSADVTTEKADISEEENVSEPVTSAGQTKAPSTETATEKDLETPDELGNRFQDTETHTPSAIPSDSHVTESEAGATTSASVDQEPSSEQPSAPTATEISPTPEEEGKTDETPTEKPIVPIIGEDGATPPEEEPIVPILSETEEPSTSELPSELPTQKPKSEDQTEIAETATKQSEGEVATDKPSEAIEQEPTEGSGDFHEVQTTAPEETEAEPSATQKSDIETPVTAAAPSASTEAEISSTEVPSIDSFTNVPGVIPVESHVTSSEGEATESSATQEPLQEEGSTEKPTEQEATSATIEEGTTKASGPSEVDVTEKPVQRVQAATEEAVKPIEEITEEGVISTQKPLSEEEPTEEKSEAPTTGESGAATEKPLLEETVPEQVATEPSVEEEATTKEEEKEPVVSVTTLEPAQESSAAEEATKGPVTEEGVAAITESITDKVTPSSEPSKTEKPEIEEPVSEPATTKPEEEQPVTELGAVSEETTKESQPDEGVTDKSLPEEIASEPAEVGGTEKPAGEVQTEVSEQVTESGETDAATKPARPFDSQTETIIEEYITKAAEIATSPSADVTTEKADISEEENVSEPVTSAGQTKAPSTEAATEKDLETPDELGNRFQDTETHTSPAIPSDSHVTEAEADATTSASVDQEPSSEQPSAPTATEISPTPEEEGKTDETPTQKPIVPIIGEDGASLPETEEEPIVPILSETEEPSTSELPSELPTQKPKSEDQTEIAETATKQSEGEVATDKPSEAIEQEPTEGSGATEESATAKATSDETAPSTEKSLIEEPVEGSGEPLLENIPTETFGVGTEGPTFSSSEEGSTRPSEETTESSPVRDIADEIVTKEIESQPEVPTTLSTATEEKIESDQTTESQKMTTLLDIIRPPQPTSADQESPEIASEKPTEEESATNIEATEPSVTEGETEVTQQPDVSEEKVTGVTDSAVKQQATESSAEPSGTTVAAAEEGEGGEATTQKDLATPDELGTRFDDSGAPVQIEGGATTVASAQPEVITATESSDTATQEPLSEDVQTESPIIPIHIATQSATSKPDIEDISGTTPKSSEEEQTEKEISSESTEEGTPKPESGTEKAVPQESVSEPAQEGETTDEAISATLTPEPEDKTKVPEVSKVPSSQEDTEQGQTSGPEQTTLSGLDYEDKFKPDHTTEPQRITTIFDIISPPQTHVPQQADDVSTEKPLAPEDEGTVGPTDVTEAPIVKESPVTDEAESTEPSSTEELGAEVIGTLPPSTETAAPAEVTPASHDVVTEGSTEKEEEVVTGKEPQVSTEKEAEVSTDKGTEEATETGVEVATEKGAGIEVATEKGVGIEAETEKGAGIEVATEKGAGIEVATEEGTGIEQVTEEGAEAQTEKGVETPTEKGTEAGTEKGIEAGTEKEIATPTEKGPVASSEEEAVSPTEKVHEDVTEKEVEASSEKGVEGPTDSPMVIVTEPAEKESVKIIDDFTKATESTTLSDVDFAQKFGEGEPDKVTTILDIISPTKAPVPAVPVEVDQTTTEPKSESEKEEAPTTEQPAVTEKAQTVDQPTFKPATSSEVPAPQYGNEYAPGPSQYPGQSYIDEEYGEEDDQAVFGPGTCRYGGKLYVSAQQIPRDDPCDFCFCFRSDIICLQQSCPPPINGCHEEPIQGFCCPRYECPVSMATVVNVTTSTTTTSTTLPPHFLHHAYRGAATKSGCQIDEHTYQVGDVVPSASGPCMQCICGGDGQMKCDPKQCTPEPMLRQMIATTTRR